MVFYASYYATKDSNRFKNYAGEDKVDYICNALNSIGESVLVLSSSKTNAKHFAKREKQHLFGTTDLLYFSSLPKKGMVFHAIDVIWGYLQLFIFILLFVQQSDTVIVYHSLGYRGLWSFLRKLKKFKYILEVEELYQSFKAANSSYKKHEKKVFRHPDAFLFSNQILADEINKDKKPAVIVNGIYKSNHRKTGICIKRVVYAGSLEAQKGVDYIIPVAEYLPPDYEIHIIGFGSASDIQRVKDKIDCSSGNISYDGVFKGEAYIHFLQTCGIGLCIQDENDVFNKYEYPSKVFSYLSNGLQVVANDLIQLRQSEVFPYLHISKSKSAPDIAEAIINCSQCFLDTTDVMEKLDHCFKQNLKLILRGSEENVHE